MLFNSRLFILVFLPVALGGFLLLSRLGRRPALGWLLAASLLFYAWWKPILLLLLLGSIAVNFALGQRIVSGVTGLDPSTSSCRRRPASTSKTIRHGVENKGVDAGLRRHDEGKCRDSEPNSAGISRTAPRKAWLAAGISCNLLLLAFFKYAGFLAALFGATAPFGGILLPLGISFFTFQQIMFLADLASGDILLPPLLDYACFIAFFPHLIAGPIVRPRHILPQLAALQPLAGLQARLVSGVEIFLLGLAKKLVLADGLAHFADPGFAAAARLDHITLIEAWVALLAYGLQIYFDFSGYSDMAIGLARLFGINFPINFNSPYQAANISDFWRRWNITLSGFLREYLYIPLGGNRHGESRRVFNLMATMLLGGLWHGAAWRFVLWGGLHGLYLIIHGWSKNLRLPPRLSWALTLFAVLMAWVPFRAQNFAAAMDFYRGLSGFNGLAIPAFLLQLAPALGRFGHIVPVLPYLGDARSMSLPQAIIFLSIAWCIALCLPPLHAMSERRRSIALVAGFALSVQALFFAPAAVPFLYFQF